MDKNLLNVSAAVAFQTHICRTCLRKITPSNSAPIFSEEEFFDGQPLRQVFIEITCTLIDPAEKLPNSVCLECVQRLKNAVIFKRSIEKADKTLRAKLRLAEWNYNMGRIHSVESMLDSFCNEIYQVSNKNKVYLNVAFEKCKDKEKQVYLNSSINKAPTMATPNKNNIRIINQTNKNNAALTAKTAKTQTPNLKSFSGRDFIENFLNKQDAKEKTAAENLVVDNCKKVYTNKKKTVDLEKDDESQYILIVQEAPDLIADEIIANTDNDVVITESVPEIIEIPDSPEPSPIQDESNATTNNIPVNENVQIAPYSGSDERLAAEMAWIEDNLDNLGTITEDDTIGCNKCDKRFTISEENNQQNVKNSKRLKYEMKTQTYLISMDAKSSSSRVVLRKKKRVQSCNRKNLNSIQETENSKNVSSQQEALVSKKRSRLSDSERDQPVAKVSRRSWTKDNMIAAITAYQENRMGYKRCAKVYGVPRTTLARYVKQGVSIETIFCKKLGRHPFFSDDVEAEIIRYVLEMKQMFYEITRNDLCKVAYDICKMYKIHNRFNSQIQRASVAWLNNFLSKNPFIVQHLTKQKRETYIPKSLTTLKFTDRFLQVYITNFNKINSNPKRLYSCYEMGFTLSQQKNCKINSVRGKQQIINLTLVEKHTLVTSLICFNAKGDFIPPSVIYAQKHMKTGLVNELPTGSLLTWHSLGWIQQKVFLEWLQHFINYVKPTASDPVVLLINGRESYVKYVDTIKLAKDNNVLLTILPPYQIFSIEPAEQEFVEQFKTLYKNKIKLQRKSYTKQFVSDIGRLYGITYSCVTAHSQVAIDGFVKSGLFPFCVETVRLHKNTNLKKNEKPEEECNNIEQVKTKNEELACCWIKEEPEDEIDILEHVNNDSDPLCVSVKEEIDDTEETELKTCIKQEQIKRESDCIWND